MQYFFVLLYLSKQLNQFYTEDVGNRRKANVNCEKKPFWYYTIENASEVNKPAYFCLINVFTPSIVLFADSLLVISCHDADPSRKENKKD